MKSISALRTTPSYFPQIDIIKGIAIISVIFLHTIPPQFLTKFHATFYISQAVPVFFIVMGITLAVSFNHVISSKNTQLYSGLFLRRARRIVLPFLIIFLVSLAFGIVRQSFYLGWLTLIGYLPVPGPGNYYVSILFEYMVLSPLIVFFWNKYPRATILTLFVANILFELVAPHISILNAIPYLYSASIFRCFSAIALGLYISREFTVKGCINLRWELQHGKGLVLLGVLISTSYLVATSFFAYTFPLFSDMWGNQNVISFFYPLLIVILLLNIRFEHFSKLYWPLNGLAIVGRASYHIFLIQILFFGFGLSFTKFVTWDSPLIMGVPVLIGNLVVTVVLGVLFYFAEKTISRRSSIPSKLLWLRR